MTCYEPQVLNASTFKGGTFFSDAVVECLSLLSWKYKALLGKA